MDRLAVIFLLLAVGAVHASSRKLLGGPALKPWLSQHEHVLFMSIDGMHNEDLTWWISNNPNGNFAKLAAMGVTYTNALVDGFTDSIPTSISLVTGAGDLTNGLTYSGCYDRSLYAPGTCVDGKLPKTAAKGAVVHWSEGLDLDSTRIDAGGGLNEALLPEDSHCKKVYPWMYPRVNNIFEVATGEGLVTAWSDKEYGTYQLYRGKNGDAVTDLYTPEDKAKDPFPPYSIDNPGQANITKEIVRIMLYDQLHVGAVLNWIKGLNHDGSAALPAVPAIFGSSFQSLNVAQKYNSAINPALTGGYLADARSFGPAMTAAMQMLDDTLGKFVTAIKDAGLDASTAIVIGSKHGQSPRDRTLLFKPAEHTLLDALTAAGIEVAYSTGDTVEIIYLLDSTRAQQAAQILTDLNNTACVTTTTTCWYGRMRGVYWGDSLATIGLAPPAQDPRMPDVVIDTQPGVIVDGSKAKLSEHGGFSAFDDRSVGLLVASPALTSAAAGSRCAAPVLSKSVAPTILALLGISPNSLAGVRHEGTPVLPCLA